MLGALEDVSWKVREAIAKQYSDLSEALGSNIVESDLAAGLSALLQVTVASLVLLSVFTVQYYLCSILDYEFLQDREGEVRNTAAKSLSKVVDMMDSKT